MFNNPTNPNPFAVNPNAPKTGVFSKPTSEPNRKTRQAAVVGGNRPGNINVYDRLGPKKGAGIKNEAAARRERGRPSRIQNMLTDQGDSKKPKRTPYSRPTSARGTRTGLATHVEVLGLNSNVQLTPFLNHLKQSCGVNIDILEVAFFHPRQLGLVIP